MFVGGKILIVPTRDRVSPGPLGVRMYDRPKCFDGYTLFSPAYGYTEAEVEPLFVSRTEEIGAVADSERKRLTSFCEVLEFYQAGFRKK